MSYFCYLICSNATFLKEEYIQLMIEWRFTRGVQPQTEKFMEGFGEVIPIEWLQYFDEAELEMILCGVQNIDIADWEKNTVLKNYQKNSKQVRPTKIWAKIVGTSRTNSYFSSP